MSHHHHAATPPVTLAFTGHYTTPNVVNTVNGETLALNVNTTASELDVNIVGTLQLTAQVLESFGHMNFIGGSIDFVGTSSFAGGGVVFDSQLKGHGVVNLNHEGNSSGSGQYEFKGPVGRNLTFNLEGGGPPESVQIDHPESFKGEIVLPGASNTLPFFGLVTFEGLHATDAFLAGGHGGPTVLELVNGHKVVDSVRLSGDLDDLYVRQTPAGVTLTTTNLSVANQMSVADNLFHT